MNNTSLAIAALDMPSPNHTLTLAPPTTASAPLSTPRPVSTQGATSTRPRILVVCLDRTKVTEVLSALPSDDLELEYYVTEDTDPEALNTATRDAEIVVLVGSELLDPKMALEPARDLNKPVIWLPIPPTASQGHDSSWRRNASTTLHAAINHLKHTAPAVAADSTPPTLDAARGELRHGDRSVRVTPTEGTLLKVLLAHRGRWLRSSELRLQAFGPHHACHDSLIRVHVYKLRRKLIDTAIQIHSAKGRGYMLA